MSDVDEWAGLARLAQAATPGPWRADDEHGLLGPGSVPAWTVSRTDADERFLGDVAYMPQGDTQADVAEARADAEFIAAANPATILRLIAENRDLSERLAQAYRDEVLAHDERDALAARLAAVEAAFVDLHHRHHQGDLMSATRWTLRDIDNRDGDEPWETTDTPANLVAYLDGPVRSDLTDSADEGDLDRLIDAFRAGDLALAQSLGMPIAIYVTEEVAR